MDILYILKEKFEELKELILKLSEGPQGEEGKPLQKEFVKKISLLSQLQGDYIYPEISGISSSLDGITGQSVEMLGRITELNAQGSASFSSLVETVKEYVNHEETLLMPKLRMAMRTEDREDLGQVVVDAEEEILRALAPSTRSRHGARVGGHASMRDSMEPADRSRESGDPKERGPSREVLARQDKGVASAGGTSRINS